MANQNFKVKNGLEVGTGVTISAGIISATKFIGDGSQIVSSQWVTISAGIHTLSNVGIGTTNPTQQLQVSGSTLISGTPTLSTTDLDGTSVKNVALSINPGIGYSATGITYTSQIRDTFFPGQNTSNHTSLAINSQILPTENSSFSGHRAIVNTTIRSNSSDSYSLGTIVSGSYNRFYHYSTLNTSAYTNSITGTRNDVQLFSGSAGTIYGSYNYITLGNFTGFNRVTAQEIYGGYNFVSIGSRNDYANTVYGTKYEVIVNNTGIVTNYYGVHLSSTVSGTGSIQNNWSVYSQDTSAKMYHAGSIGIGTTNPISKLHVVGDTLVTGVITATTFSGNASNATYAVTAGVSTFSGYSDTTGFSTFSGYSNLSGISTYASSAGIATTTTNIPNLTGDITSNGTATSIASGVIVNDDINASAAIAVSKLSASTISGVTLGNNLSTLTLNTSGTGLSGSTTFNGSGASTFTVTSNATSSNTNSTIVARDASGNFSAGTITATLSGTATQVSNTLTLNTSGTGLSGSTTFNGSGASTFTVTSNATSSNTASAIVARDASGNFSAGAITGTSISDSSGNVRAIPQNPQTSAYILAIGDVGKHISITTGGVTVNSGIFSAGDAVTIYNNSGSNQTITQGTSVTMYLAGTATTGNRTLAQRGVCTVLCVASNTFVISGAGLS